MCLTFKHEFEAKFTYVKKGEAYASPQKHKFKNLKFYLIKVRHVPHF